jgi:hypothetical protein
MSLFGGIPKRWKEWVAEAGGRWNTSQARVDKDGHAVILGLDPHRPDQKPPVEWSSLSETFWTRSPISCVLERKGVFASADGDLGDAWLSKNYRLRESEGELPRSIFGSVALVAAIRKLAESNRRAMVDVSSYDPQTIREKSGRLFALGPVPTPRHDPRFTGVIGTIGSPRVASGEIADPFDTSLFITTVAVRFHRKETRAHQLDAALEIVTAIAEILREGGIDMDVWCRGLEMDQEKLEKVFLVPRMQ